MSGNMELAGEFAVIASGIYLEGLAIDNQRNIVWYSDVIAGGVYGLLPNGRTVSLNPGRMWTGGIMLNADGAVLSSGQGGIMWNNPDSGQSGWLLQEIDGQAINGVNEMTPDGAGGLVFGTCDIENVARGEQPRPTTLYRLTAQRKVIKLADGIGFSNGLMYDKQRHRLYCNDTFKCTWAFAVHADFALADKTLLVGKDDADGMALDAEGNVWLTGFRSSHLTRISAAGSLLPPVATPASAVTQVRFGGADMRDVYLTTVPADGGDNLKDGAIPTEKNSKLYRGRAAIPGMVIETANFKLGR
jgi:sugar lactone lactonase YvrE